MGFWGAQRTPGAGGAGRSAGPCELGNHEGALCCGARPGTKGWSTGVVHGDGESLVLRSSCANLPSFPNKPELCIPQKQNPAA